MERELEITEVTENTVHFSDGSEISHEELFQLSQRAADMAFQFMREDALIEEVYYQLSRLDLE